MKTKLLLVVVLAALVGISLALQKNASPGEDDNSHEEEQQESPKPAEKKPVKTASYEPGKVASIKTNRGVIKFVLFEKDMPVTCKNFVDLVNSGFYKNHKFHRVEDWVIQTGDPTGTGTGGSPDKIKLEMCDGLGFEVPYMVGMARQSGDQDSASSQFFITMNPVAQLQDLAMGGGYACFGLVFTGQDVVKNIKLNDTMESITISEPTEEELKLIETGCKALIEAKAKMPEFKPVPAPGASSSSESQHEHDENCGHDHGH
ncbi:MAG TPA: peptidylprolyl isomerase [Armatimonadota bacterium]|nr:peptidylprolyl isomerase [Armatimonadota bacterium]